MAKTVKSGAVLDRLDQARIMDWYGPSIYRCKGNRFVAQGFICPHCNSTDPTDECHQPAIDD